MYIWEKINPPVLDFNIDVYNSMTTFGKYAYRNFYRDKYIGAILSGDFGIGKTTTAIHLGREIAQAIYGVNEEQGLQIALQNMVFTMDEVIEATRNLGSSDEWKQMNPYDAVKRSHSERKPFIIWDDAGMHGSKYKHFLDMSSSYDLQSNFDTIRDTTACMIITVPEDEELLHFLRNYRGNYMVEIINIDGSYVRKLHFWKYGLDKMGRKRRYKKWESREFSIHVKQPYYGQYKIMKKVAKIENYEQYKKRKEQREEENKMREIKMKLSKIRMQGEIQKIIKKKEEQQDGDDVEDSEEETG